ncbi:thioredoxin domain-containing protein [Archangium violaceum]|uniref:thioredoxin domain-containing protein n=1 Tax=Archangium violaceum TaxID=83451 RepID=UPI00193C5F27|nr:thioredoxin domain-containing protein [Archangium violaceum]QRK05107.1 thioredoxin domain-containing protein [Archangium violaceum]
MHMRSTSTLMAALLAASLFSGCNKEKAPATAATPTATAGTTAEPSADTVVATFGDGQKITFGELNERIKEPLANLDKQKFQLRKQGLDGFVVEKLVQAEAKKRNLTEEQLIKAEVDDKIPQPPEAEIKKLYDEAKERLPPGTTFEQVKPQIVDFLNGSKKQERAREYFNELKKNANVQITLPEPPKPPVERKQVAATGPSKGPENAPITIVEFSDFQCPFCSRAIGTVEEVLKAYPNQVRLVFRQFPLEFHQQAPKAAEASLCAHDQGKFWEYHDTLFANQKALEVPQLKEHAKKVGLDSAAFDKCLDSGAKAEIVKADMADGQKVGVNGTPAFFINGILLSGAQPFDEFKSVIDSELQAKK